MTTATFHPSEPLLSIREISRIYERGDNRVYALDKVSLEIFPGEFVAIMGQSGSGKSTLMNIIGCLDRPSSGTYTVNGQDVAGLTRDELAGLRRDTFGFIFQRYNLLETVTAVENVEIPAVYAGRSRRSRLERARSLLDTLGLADRAEHRPSELSGGQQQRVSIARALMNDAEVILADEPTGALDSQSGDDVLTLLKQLHAEGRTIVLITHDNEVAAHAERVIRIADGRIVDDTGMVHRWPPVQAVEPELHSGGFMSDLSEAVKMALRSLRANLFRSSLTLLGIVIGVGAVVSMLAIGEGSRLSVLRSIESMGTNLVMIRPGAPGIRPSGDIVTLTPGDAKVLQTIPGVENVSPERNSQMTLRYGSEDYRTRVQGVWPGYALARDWTMATGGFITEGDVTSYAPVVVLGQTAAKNLFPNGTDPIGKYVLIQNVPFEVIGVLSPKGATPFGSDQDDVAMVPLSTGFMRLFGRQYVNTIMLKVYDASKIDSIQNAITRLLISRHRTQDFQVRNTASILQMASETQQTMTVLLGTVAAISLLVGGIGVMNIMLVSVTERKREIGIRMATGARPGNILLQFNTEALVICGIGGLVGVALGILSGVVAKAFGVSVAFSPTPAVLAFSCAFATGLLFGFLPARQASRLDPVVALAAE